MSGASSFQDRKASCEKRLDALRQDLAGRLTDQVSIDLDPQLCIYTTGSLARLEATTHSDLDAFFILSGSSNKTGLSRIRDVKILSAIVDAAEDQGFPDFSNDGEYLRFLHIDDIVADLGGRHDDYHNAFTARMLLILEGKYLFNQASFKFFKDEIVESYFRDFHGHATDFRPTFLVNDVLRFWRTLCLNYEHGRKWRGEITPERRAKGHLSNLKLKFSRMSICFSFIAYLLSLDAPPTPEDVIKATDLTPRERLDALRIKHIDLNQDFTKLFDCYDWFLEVTGHEKHQVLTRISDRGSRDEAFKKAKVFGNAVFSIVHQIATEKDYLRILVV